MLADLARRADHALLHDAYDIVPGLQELVEAHRIDNPTVEAVRSMTFDISARGYDLLLGLRRPRDWAAMRRASFGASLDSLRHAYHVTVADLDDDLEGWLQSEEGRSSITHSQMQAITDMLNDPWQNIPAERKEKLQQLRLEVFDELFPDGVRAGIEA